MAKYINKYSVGSFLGVLLILTYTVFFYAAKIEVSLPSDKCGTALLRVTKDDFTLKCGRRIAYQGDVIVEYFKTYGTDEWVRDYRYVGRNKKDIDLELFEYGDSFEIIKTTRYRKGRQYKVDGVLEEIFTFTKDKVKISYNFEPENNALHRITLRTKKIYEAYLDPADPNGNTAIQIGDKVYYEGKGNLYIDPSISMYAPANLTKYNESDTAVFTCNVSSGTGAPPVNASFFWDYASIGTLAINGTTAITTNGSITWTRTLDHSPRTGNVKTINWTCRVCNGTGTAANCSYLSENKSINVTFKPHTPDITSPENANLILLNGSGTDWGFHDVFPQYHPNATDSFYINWTHSGHPNYGSAGDITWNVSYYGSTNTSNVVFSTLTNSSQCVLNQCYALFNFTNLTVDRYYLRLQASTTDESSLAVTNDGSEYIDVLDYNLTTSVSETTIRFSPMPSITKGAAFGQTADKGILMIDWMAYAYPTGSINISLNMSYADACCTFYASEGNYPDNASTLTNNTYIPIMNHTYSDPDYIWLWLTKSSCGSTTTAFTLDMEVLR